MLADYQTATAVVEKPGCILSRGKKAYVVNSGKGTITVLDRSKKWKAVKTLSCEDPGLYYLSAARGGHFDGRIIASSVTVARSGRYVQGATGRCYLLDATSGKCALLRRVPSFYVANVSYNGNYVLDIGSTPPQDFDDFVRPGRPAVDTNSLRCSYQVRPGP